MRILVVGGGGREHALCWALRRELPTAHLWCAPGNPGTAGLADNLPLAADDVAGLTAAARRHQPDLTIVGPEVPLALGLADQLRAANLPVLGPVAAAAKLEASKEFAKEIMVAAGVPTAPSATFTDLAAALRHVDSHPEPVVVKASGLAAGKGAVVCPTRADAARTVRRMLSERAFGPAGDVVVIERFLEGEELSVLALTDGQSVSLLPPSQDHKRLAEGDTGPNTGGMGAYSPVSLATPALLAQVESEVLQPTLAEMARRGIRFRGVLYAGLMVAPDGRLAVVEFNVRLGDPEAQVVLPLVAGGLARACQEVATGRAPGPLDLHSGAAVTTVLAARGYPAAPEKGAPITIPERLPDGVTVFHAGTTRDPDGTLRVAGGRVLNVTGVAPTFAEARRLSREAAEAIAFAGKVFRRDIGWREEARKQGRGERGDGER